MPVPSTIADLTTTAATNSPSGSENRSTADDYIRALSAILKGHVSQGSDIASASSLALPATGSYFDVTGTTTISGISSTNSWDGRLVCLQFDSALTLTHSASFNLGGRDIKAYAGRKLLFVQTSSGNWSLLSSPYIVHVKDFGAVGDGTTNDASAIQAAMDSISSTGGTVYFDPKTYAISSTLTGVRGVSLVGHGAAPHYIESDSKLVTRLKWTGAANGTMFNAGQRWQGQIKRVMFDANSLAQTALNLGASQSSTFQDITVRSTASGSAAIILTTTGQFYPDGTTQYPSAGFNLFERVHACDGIGGQAMLWDGTLDGSNLTVGAVTENTVRDCKLTGASGSYALVLNKCCDTNNFYNCAIDSAGAGVAIVLNFSSVNDGVFGNQFFACAIENLSASGTGVDARNNAFHNNFYGCFWPSTGTVYTSGGSGGGKVKMWGATQSQEGGSFSDIASPVAGASPWTYTNTNPYAVEFRLWGGTTTAISLVRNGASNAIGGVSTSVMQSFLLEPGDGITVTYSAGAPSAQIQPH